MPDNLGYLFAAFAVIWIGLFGYVILLSSQIRQLRDEVRLLKEGTQTEPEIKRLQEALTRLGPRELNMLREAMDRLTERDSL